MNPVAFKLFDTPIYWYGIIIASGILIALIIAIVVCKKLKYKEDIPYEILLFIVPLGILGARTYFVIFSESSYSFAEFFDLRSGGIAIYGAIIAGALGLFIYSRIKKCSFFALTDIVVVSLIIAQCIGRWGNFFNQEAYGRAVDFSFFPFTVDIDNCHMSSCNCDGSGSHMATFFYESFLNLIGFFVLLKVLSKQKKIGTVTATYFIHYGIVRSIVEPLRTDSLMMFGIIRVSVAVSIVLIILGIVLLLLNHKNKISQENKKLLDTKKKETVNVRN